MDVSLETKRLLLRSGQPSDIGQILDYYVKTGRFIRSGRPDEKSPFITCSFRKSR
jgi:hypothetical protein